MVRQMIILHSESEFITMTNQSHFKHITSLKRNYKLHQRALTLSYDEETTLLTNNLLRKIFFHMTPHFKQLQSTNIFRIKCCLIYHKCVNCNLPIAIANPQPEWTSGSPTDLWGPSKKIRINISRIETEIHSLLCYCYFNKREVIKNFSGWGYIVIHKVWLMRWQILSEMTNSSRDGWYCLWKYFFQDFISLEKICAFYLRRILGY